MIDEQEITHTINPIHVVSIEDAITPRSSCCTFLQPEGRAPTAPRSQRQTRKVQILSEFWLLREDFLSGNAPSATHRRVNAETDHEP